MGDDLIIRGSGYIDHIAVAVTPTRRAQLMIVHRTYRRIAEKLDLQVGVEGWVRLRRALQGGQVL